MGRAASEAASAHALLKIWARTRRHHRYIFEERKAPSKGAKKGDSGKEEGPLVGARLQELGPRFTLKLRSMQVPWPEQTPALHAVCEGPGRCGPWDAVCHQALLPRGTGLLVACAPYLLQEGFLRKKQSSRCLLCAGYAACVRSLCKAWRQMLSWVLNQHAIPIAFSTDCGLRWRLSQAGTFDSKEGEFEFMYKPKMAANRRRFVL